MRLSLSSLALVLGLSSVSCYSLAETENTPVNHDYSGFNLAIGQVNFDKQASQDQGVSDSATFIKLGWEKQTDQLVFGGGISGYLYSDHQKFKQDVKSQLSGNVSGASSNAQAVNLYGELGYSYVLNDALTAQLFAGAEIVLQSERSIANCSNCYSSDIKLDSGLYLSPRLHWQATENAHWTLYYQQYLGGDVKNAVALSFIYNL